MKKLILGTAAVIAFGMAPAYAEDHGHAATEAAPAVKAEAAAETAVKTEAPAAAEAAVEAKTVAELAAVDAELSTLVSALAAADLTTELKGTGPFTVFAPSNAAFEKLGKEKLADLMKPENKDKLVALLKHHVVPGKIDAAQTKAATVDLTTLGGDVVKVDGKGAAVKVGEATVTKADIVASNGVVHVIDAVLVPVAKEPAKTE